MGLHTDGDLIALLPGLHKLRDHLRRILEVCCHQDGRVARGLEHRIIRRVELTEIFRIENALHVSIFSTEGANLIPCVIGGVIVDIDDFIFIGGKLLREKLLQRFIKRDDIFFLVIAWNDDANCLHVDFL